MRLPGFPTRDRAGEVAAIVAERHGNSAKGKPSRILIWPNPAGGFQIKLEWLSAAPAGTRGFPRVTRTEIIGDGPPHKFFTVEPCSGLPRDGRGAIGNSGLALFFNVLPVSDFAAGSVAIGMTFPALIAGHLSDPKANLDRIAEILNAHWTAAEDPTDEA